MRDLDVVLAVIGGLVLILGLFSQVIKSRTIMSVPLASLLVGVLLNPHVTGALDVSAWGEAEMILEQAARLTLAIGLMALALRIPPDFLRQSWRPLAVLILIVMPLMWLFSSLMTFVLLETTLLAALLIGAIITPTDPVVATAIVTGRTAEEHLPPRIRHMLSAESGFNDGLALLLVMLPLLLLGSEPAAALGEWVTRVLLQEVVGGIVLGLLAGYAAGKILLWAEEHHSIEHSSFLSYTVALAFLTLGVARMAGADGLLAVFLAGLSFDAVVGGGDRAEEADIQETVNQFFTLPIFALLGLALPLPQWIELGWRGPALAGGILLLRRLPAMLVVRPMMSSVRGWGDILFIGWFGPIGVSAMLYAMLAIRHSGLDLWPAVSLVICASVAVHGITSTPFMKSYARRHGNAELRHPSRDS